jgi:hypothetical protein
MTHFESKTQYDDKYGGINHNVCSLFALISAHNFMKNSNISKEQYVNNLDDAVHNFTDFGLEGEMDFKSVLALSDLNIDNIGCTTVELIKSKELGYDKIIPNDDIPYALIFLKNSKYFVVTFNGNKYSIRDCHEICQYDFDSKNDLIGHLNKIYQFDRQIDLDGFVVAEFSNIEYLHIFMEFNVNLVITINPEPIKQEQINPISHENIDNNYDYGFDYGIPTSHVDPYPEFVSYHPNLKQSDYNEVNYDEYEDEDIETYSEEIRKNDRDLSGYDTDEGYDSFS